MFRNDGSGPFVDASTEFLLGERIQGFLVHFVGIDDFTGDGLEDIFVADNGPECAGTLQAYAYPNSIRVGTASGKLDNESATRLPQTPDADHRAAAADLDGDGDLDVVGFGVGFPNPYFINNGSGVFTRKLLSWSPSDADTSVATIDADLDGDIDLFVGDNANTLHNTLLLNNGKAAFTVAPQGWLPRKNRGKDYVVVHAMVPVDIDGDGILDIVASEQPPPTAGTPESPFLQLLLGNGDGTFRDASSRLGAQDWPEGLAGEPFGAGLFYFEPFDQNGYLWPTLVKFSTSEVRVWVRQIATNTIKAYVLAGAGPTSSDLSGSFDRLGFLPPGKQQLQPAATEAGPGARVATHHADPAPPGNNWLTTPEVPGFRFQVRITAGGPPFLGAKVNACIEETLCVSGAIAGRPEVFARVVGPKPNGYLWPTIVKFTTSQLEVWVEQTKTGIVKYYLLAGAGPTSSDLPGFFDRTGFQP